MNPQKKHDPIETVKASLRRKALDARGGKPLPNQNAKRKTPVKPEKDENLFDPDAFKGDQPLRQLGRQPRGNVPDLVKEKYG